MNMINFIFLTFGENINNHAQAIFSILTVKKFSNNFPHKIIVYTDSPKFFVCLKNIVEIRHTPKELLREWEGEYEFFWRVKIMAMLDSAKKDQGHICYLDSDTFAFKNLDSMLEKLNEDTSFMHLPENPLSVDCADDKKLMWDQVKERYFGGMKIDEKTMMWNAGVVAFSSNSKLNLLNRALAANDEMLENKVTRRLIEQFSLSLALQNHTSFDRASFWIGHYWGNKEEWNREIQCYFSRAFQLGSDIERMANELDINYFSKIPIIRHKKSWNKKFMNFAGKYLKDSTTLIEIVRD